MDGTLLQLAVYVVATFVAAVVAGVSGFAFALIAAAAWLHVLTPLQTAALIVACAMLVQTYGAWKMSHAARCSPGPGWASSSTAGSITQPFALSCCSCCLRPDCR